MEITLVGVGMGDPGTMTADGRAALLAADAVLGGARVLEALPQAAGGQRVALYRAEDILTWLEAHEDFGRVCVAYSGDVGFYSGATQLYPRLRAAGYPVRCINGVSTVAYLCARLGIPWQDVQLASAHGVDCDPLAHVLNYRRSFFLTSGPEGPGDICAALAEAGLGDTRVVVGEHLSYPGEALTEGTASELAGRIFHSLNAVLVLRERPTFVRAACTGGIPDGDFLRGKAPMTKREVRAVALSKLELTERDVVYDIGAGTGSVAVEAALAARWGRVFAVERDPAAAALIRQNRERFGVYNLAVKEGPAPAALEGLPAPDAVFVGGTGGGMGEILAAVAAKGRPFRLVASAVTLETVHRALRTMEELGFTDIDAVQIAVTRTEIVGAAPAGTVPAGTVPVQGSRMLRALNPVFLLTGTHIPDERWI